MSRSWESAIQSDPNPIPSFAPDAPPAGPDIMSDLDQPLISLDPPQVT